MKASRIAGLIATVVLATIWFVLFRPGFLGGSTEYVIVSGDSMLPTLKTDDLVLVRRQADYEEGDIVAFRVEKSRVIHRIVGGDADSGFVMQGDNKKLPDIWKPKPADIVGKEWVRLPNGAAYIRALSEPRYFGVLVGGITLFLLLGDVGKTKTPQPMPSLRRFLRPRRTTDAEPALESLYAADHAVSPVPVLQLDELWRRPDVVSPLIQEQWLPASEVDAYAVHKPPARLATQALILGALTLVALRLLGRSLSPRGSRG